MKTIESSKIFLLNRKCQFLLYLRDNKPEIPYHGHWDIFGGEIEINETPLQALKRECLEKFGEIPEEINFIEGVFFPKHYLHLNSSKNNFFIGYINTPIEKLKENFNKSNEGQDIAYFDFEDLENLKFPYPLLDFIYKHKNLFLK